MNNKSIIIDKIAEAAKKSVPHGILSPDRWVEEYNKQLIIMTVDECIKIAKKADSYKVVEAIKKHFMAP